MCLAIPLRVAHIEGDTARVEVLGGVLLEVSVMLTPEVRVGDYVLVHTGFAISVLDEEEAAETLALFAEMAEAERQMVLKEADRGAGTSTEQGAAS